LPCAQVQRTAVRRLEAKGGRRLQEQGEVSLRLLPE